MAFTTKSGRTETSMSEINVTPFVDVVLVLLIIFMVTAPVLQSGIEVNVPKTKTVKAISEQRLVISITKSQEVYLGNDHVKLAELGDLLRKKIRDPQGQSVYVRADQDVAFGAFATVMSTVKQAGITNVSIVTEPIPPEKK
jgi:biopolymer transport protein TolR